MSDFEDPTALARCIKSDCEAYRVGNSPLCARHLRKQEKAAGATSISEPDVEARVARVRTEDDDHPGMVKVYDKQTGEPSWVPAETMPPRPTRIVYDDGTSARVEPGELYMGPDPDVNGLTAPLPEAHQRPSEAPLRPAGGSPDFSAMEPVLQGGQWVLRPRAQRQGPDLNAIRSAVRDLMHELGIVEAEHPDD